MTEELVTEQRNPRTVDIDVADTLDILTMLNDEDARVPAAVRAVLPELARVVDAAVDRFRSGGTIYYFGAGASGRIAALDAAELPPTFSIPAERVVARIAGGADALVRSYEELEDDAEAAARDAAEVKRGDIVFGLTASGSTPYVVGAISTARAARALCVVVSSNDNPALRSISDHYLQVDTGAEPIAGSTRMKAATAQKLILNGFSTALMVRLGMTYSNLMIEVAQTNDKLRARSLRLLMEATGRSESDCRRHLERTGGRVKVALLTLMGAENESVAISALEMADGHAREALRHLDGQRSAD
jgi:N-acetylmuramic acid 6-phosphate etherase